VILTLMVALFPISVASAGNVTISIDAPDEELDAGSELVVTVSITEVTDIDSFQFDVSYDPSIIEVIGAEGAGQGVTDGLIDSTAVPIPMWGFEPPGTQGTIKVLGNMPGIAGVSGSGYLAQIHFNVTGWPGSTSELTLSEGQLWDNMGAEISVAEWVGDSVKVYGVATGPIIGFGPRILSFSASEGGDKPADETLEIWNSGVGTLEWTASGTTPWLSLDATSGSSSGAHDKNAVDVSVDISGMVAGSYHGTITISDPEAINDPQTLDVSLEISSPGALHADFTATPRTGLAPASVDFTDKTTGGTAPYTHEWDFGDGETSTAENPSHTYAAVGIYTVTLAVTDDVGATDSETKQDYITVTTEAPPTFSVSQLTISPKEVEVGNEVSITAEVTNTDDSEASCDVILKINDAAEATKPVTLAPGTSETVAFTVSRDVAGTYDVDVGGQTGEFTVRESGPAPSGPNWPLIGGIIGAVVVIAGLLVYFLVVRKRA
jgi:PKD repeat protein